MACTVSPSLGFIAKLRLEYEDGTIENIVTGTDWSCSYCGPVISGDIYNGETYDARRESDWSMPEYDTSEWFATAENTEFNGEITAFCGPTVKVRDFLRRTPQTITVYEGTKSLPAPPYGTINVVRTLEGTETLRLKAGENRPFRPRTKHDGMDTVHDQRRTRHEAPLQVRGNAERHGSRPTAPMTDRAEASTPTISARRKPHSTTR